MFVVFHMYINLAPKSTDQAKRNLKYSVGICFVPVRISLVTTFSTAPSMFGRDLGEQVRADSKEVERRVPIIVEKCIHAVEVRG